MWTWSYCAAGITESSSSSGLILDPQLMLKLLVSCHTKRREWKLHIQPLPSLFLLKLKLHLTKLQPTKHSMNFSKMLFSWPVYFLKESKILYHYFGSDNCVVFRWLKDEVVWWKDNWWCQMWHQTSSFPWWTELCCLLLKSETPFSAVILLLTLWLHEILCTYFYFIWKFFTFAELLCARMSLVVHWNVQKQHRGTPKTFLTSRKILFSQFVALPSLLPPPEGWKRLYINALTQ